MREGLRLYASFQDLDVLIVEPSAMQQRAVREALGKLGVGRVQGVDSGATALGAMRAAPPALVVGAMYLADMSGVELLAAMRADESLAGVAFVLVSSEMREEILDPIRQSGASAILPKPFSEADLAAALAATLDWLNPHQRLDTDLDLDRLRVLLVDDSPNARKFMRRVLGNLGMENITEAGDGREAAGLLAGSMFDLVITDYNMPEMDGLALLRHIRNESWQSSVPVLMVTSETNPQRLAEVRAAGVSGICDKPFEPREVQRLIEAALSGTAGE